MVEILDLSKEKDVSKYNEIYDIINNKDPYFLYDYIKIFSKGTDDLISFLYYDKKQRNYILMPGYLTSIEIPNETSGFLHFSSPYGYTGPLIPIGIEDKIIKIFWIEVNNWYKSNRVISEFIRFNLFENHKNYDSYLHKTMLNIKGRILDEDEQWKSFDYKVRKNVNKAKRECLDSQVFYLNIPEIEIKKFYDIYIQTMVRTNASKIFFYQLEEFKLFINNNTFNTALCNIYFENCVISSELILVSENTIYSFLGGTDENYFYKRPNDFLKYELINWARRNNKKFYVLGGGYGYEDGIFNYKKSFFPNDIVEYKTGRKIVDTKSYFDLVEKNNKYRVKSGFEPLALDDDSYFPLFNKKD